MRELTLFVPASHEKDVCSCNRSTRGDRNLRDPGKEIQIQEHEIVLKAQKVKI